MGFMLGVEDRYNMCLLPFDSVVVVCQAMIRYIFLPLIQLETPEFRRMVNALCNGLSTLMPHMTYDIQMFTVKRMIGVPGYQYGLDLAKETICRPLFSQKEANDLREQIFQHTGVEYREFTFSTFIPIVKIRTLDKSDLLSIDSNGNELPTRYPITSNHFIQEDNNDYNVDISFADPEKNGWQFYLNDSQYYKLSRHDQIVVKIRIYTMWLGEFRLFRYLIEAGLSLIFYLMRRRNNSKRIETVLKAG